MLKQLLHNRLFLLLGFGFLLQLILLPLAFNGDMANHFAWRDYILHHGSVTVYLYKFEAILRADANYPPLFLWLCTVSFILVNVLKSTLTTLNTLVPFFPSKLVSGFDVMFYFVVIFKFFLLLANLGIALLSYRFVSNQSPKLKSVALVVSGLIMLNPTIIYGSTLWGQIDILPLFLILASFYTLFHLLLYI